MRVAEPGSGDESCAFFFRRTAGEARREREKRDTDREEREVRSYSLRKVKVQQGRLSREREARSAGTGR